MRFPATGFRHPARPCVSKIDSVTAHQRSSDPDTDPDKVQSVANAQTSYDKYRENIEVMRSLHNAFGYGAYRTDAPFYY